MPQMPMGLARRNCFIKVGERLRQAEMERPRPTARLFPMSQKRFSQPVRIHIAQLGTVRDVSDVHEALDCLMYGWPTERNSQHTRAIEKCLNVLAKNALAHEAEAAFSDAADQAGILLREKGPRGVR